MTLAAQSNLQLHPTMKAAIAEISELITASYPGTEFVVDREQNQEAVYVTAIVDVDDPDEVVDRFIDRILFLQVEEGLPLHVIPVRTPERRQRLLAELLDADPNHIDKRSVV